MKRITAGLFICAGLAAAAGCNGTPTTPGPSGGATSVTLVFSGSFTPGESPSNNFSLPGGAPLYITLGSLTNTAGVPLGSAVTLKFGISPAAGGCDALSKVGATASLKAQINILASAGNYCVGLEDTTGVPVGANYSIRVVYGTPSGDAAPGTIVYANTVLPGGYTTRSFHATTDGVVTIGMDAVGPVSTIGFGLGFLRNDGIGCELTTSIMASAGSQVAVPVDAGEYCIKVFDPGTLAVPAIFTARIIHP